MAPSLITPRPAQTVVLTEPVEYNGMTHAAEHTIPGDGRYFSDFDPESHRGSGA
jgi:hypothetical protein